MPGLLAGVAAVGGALGGAVLASPAQAAAPGSSFSATASLLTARAHAVTVRLANGDVLVAGGLGVSGAPLASAELYDPATGAFTATGSLPVAVTGARAVRLGDGEVLVAGGLTGSAGALVPTSETALYNPATGTFGATGSLPVAVAQGSMALLSNGQVLYAGGTTGTGKAAAATTDAEVFNPASGTWTKTGALGLGVAGAATAVLPGGDVLVAGGLTQSAGAPPSVTGVTERYQLASGSFAPVNAMAASVAEATATVLSNGQVLVAGGETTASGTPTAASQLFDPTSDTWTTTGALPFASYGATATALSSGQVLYAGGLTSGSGDPTGLAALFEPSSAQWAATGPLSVARGFAGAARLSGGQVLVAGGQGASGPIAEAELAQATAAPAITSTNQLTVKLGSPVSFTVTATGSPTPQLSESGTLPPGLSFHDNGNGTATISGTPSSSVPASASVTLVATNGVGSPAVQTLSITVQGIPTPPPTTTPPPSTTTTTTPPPTPAPTPVSSPRGIGYWYSTYTGRVFTKGSASLIAPLRPQHPHAIVAMAKTPDQRGYYLVSSYGGVFNYGDAHWYGSIAGRHLPTSVVAFAVTPSGNGYYVVTRAGNVFGFGDARFFGSTAYRGLPPIAAFGLTPHGNGYWLVSIHGNVYRFGSARFFGSTARVPVSPIRAFAPTPNGQGYWLISVNGSVHTFGDAGYFGGLGSRRIPPVTAFAPTADGQGYWLVTSRGNIFNFGDARWFGSSAGSPIPGYVSGFVPQF